MQNNAQLRTLSDWTQELRPHLAPFMAALGALAGAGVFFGLPFDPWWGWGLPVAGAGLLVMGLARARSGVALGLGLVVGGAAFGLAGWQVMRVETVDYAAAHKVHWLVGRVNEIVQKPDNPARVTLRLDRVETYGLGDGEVAGASIGVYKSQASALGVGSHAALPVVLMAPEGPEFKGQRDGRLWRYFNGGRVAGYVLGSVEPTWRAEPQEPPFAKAMDRVEGVRQRIYAATSKLADGAVAALLIGEEKGIPPQVQDAYRATGLTHLLAISGMQMTLVALGIFWLVRWLGALVPWVALRVNVRLWAAVVALAGTVFYTFLAGASVSLVRASIMAGIVMIAVLTGRMKNALRGWCAAVILILLISPVLVTRAGFQLSVAAVLGLLVLSVAERGQWQGGKAAAWARELLLATVVAECATAPLLMANFGQFSVLGVLANLVAVPVMGLATYMGMVALVLWPFGMAGTMLGMMGVVVGWVNAWALWLSGLGFASVIVPVWMGWVVAMYCAVVLWAVFVKRWVEAVVGMVSLTVMVLVVAVSVPKPDIMVWNDGKVGIVRAGAGYKLLWAERKAEAVRLAKLAGIKLDAQGEVPQEVDERFMPVTPYEHFAWAEKAGGRWVVQPVTCGRVWQRMAAECLSE